MTHDELLALPLAGTLREEDLHPLLLAVGRKFNINFEPPDINKISCMEGISCMKGTALASLLDGYNLRRINH